MAVLKSIGDTAFGFMFLILAGINTGLNNALTGMGNSSKVILELILIGMMAIDLGGQFYFFLKLKIKNLEDKEMKEFKYVVTDNEGIHARPAGELVKLVKGFESKITIEKDGKTVECRKLLALMGLGVKKGHEVTFTFDGADEDAAYEAVSKFMQENL